MFPHRRGLSFYARRLHKWNSLVNGRRMTSMTPMVPTEDLIDAVGVAELLGLRHRNSVSTYQHRYPDMPRPVIDLGPSRSRLWRRSEIEVWIRRRGNDL